MEIHVGRNYSAQTSQQVLHIESVTIHPHYYNNSFVDNIALIQLSTPANTSHWSITPICVAVTPDLQCNHSLNLTVSTSKEPQQSVKSVDVSVLSDSICIEKYGRFGINPTLANKRFCAQTHQPCNFSLIAEKYTPHISGAILQQARTFAGETHSQHFLIGFDLMGRHCDLNMPPIYLNASAYMDWILYNMKLPVQNVTHIDMETDWSKLLQGPDSEKLRLFNMTTCGIQAYNYTMTSYPWTGQNSIALIEFWQPADISNPYIRPICLPFAESMQNNKLNQFVALASDSLSKQFSNVRRTNFTLINMTTCRQRCEQEGILLNPADVTLCAIHRNAEDKKWNKISTGSALQARLDFDGQKRYFLRGLHFRRKGQYEKNDHLGNPVYLFEDIYRYLGWILSIVSIRKGNDAFLEPVNTLALRSEIVISPPVKQYKKRRMFNFSTCGITANVSNRIHPWLGKLRSNAPSFDVIECTVILISEWYVICTARSASNDTEKMIELGFNTHSEDVQKIPIGQITVHHLYEAHPQMHDMALIRLARSAIITELSVVPICLPILEDVRSYTKDNLATFR
uniref:Peptidase S1 domain-containing protein n=1 Tax=Anopheles arabiensis TaxID=7173 RepID=A0A182HGW9_ANOAR